MCRHNASERLPPPPRLRDAQGRRDRVRKPLRSVGIGIRFDREAGAAREDTPGPAVHADLRLELRDEAPAIGAPRFW